MPKKQVSPEVTDLLRSWAHGDSTVEEKLMTAVYGELSRIASKMMSRERSEHTLDPTSLVHEAYLRLIDQKQTKWCSRAHFYAIAAKMMRRVLLDHAKASRRGKRGGGEWVRIALNPGSEPTVKREMTFGVLDDALKSLASQDPRKAQLVELRFFGGLSIPEAAAVLACSERTAARDWRMAKAWLLRELKPEVAE